MGCGAEKGNFAGVSLGRGGGGERRVRGERQRSYIQASMTSVFQEERVFAIPMNGRSRDRNRSAEFADLPGPLCLIRARRP